MPSIFDLLNANSKHRAQVIDHRTSHSGAPLTPWHPSFAIPPSGGKPSGTRVASPSIPSPQTQGPQTGVAVQYDAAGNGYDANGNLVAPAPYAQQAPQYAQPQSVPGVPVQCDAYGNCYDAYGNLVSQAPQYATAPQGYAAPPQPGGFSGIDPARGFDPGKYASAEEAAAHGEFFGGWLDDLEGDLGDAFSFDTLKKAAVLGASIAGGADVGKLAAHIIDAAAGDPHSHQVVAAAKQAAQSNPAIASAVQTATKSVQQAAVGHQIQSSGAASYDAAILLLATAA